MTVREIVIAHLKALGYAGLYTDGCGCPIDDLAPCDGGWDCIPGVLVPCPDSEDGPCIGPKDGE